jgi:ketol-acid reductoisomerase
VQSRPTRDAAPPSAGNGLFECLHEVKRIVDLIQEGGIATMNHTDVPKS